MLSLLFLIANTAVPIASLVAGPLFYDYGFSGAMLLTLAVSLFYLSHTLEGLEFNTFMLQSANC